MSVVNAKIERTMIGKEGHGIPTCNIMFTWSSSGQSFGGYDMRHDAHKEFIQNVIDVAGVDTWEDLPGTFMRIDWTNERILSIGHIVENKWFRPNGGIYKRGVDT